jgi:hypothetical protein
MRTILKNHDEVAHFWANKVQSNGQGSNMFFKDDIIYSYGYHFPIAKHINNDLILFTTKGYSVSTSKHLSIAKRAIPSNIEVLNVPNVDIYKHTRSLHIDNVKYFINEIKINLDKSTRARKYKEYYLNNYLSNIKTLKRYLELFKIKSKLPYNVKNEVNKIFNMDKTNILNDIKKEQDKQKKQLEQQKKQLQLKIDKLLPEWRNNEIKSIPNNNKQYLRITENNIETSLNVRIDIELFKKYYKLLKKGISLVGQNISHYRVLKQDSKFLTIGCHKIEIKEIENTYKLIA